MTSLTCKCLQCGQTLVPTRVEGWLDDAAVERMANAVLHVITDHIGEATFFPIPLVRDIRAALLAAAGEDKGESDGK